jgi:hypothetical protein
VHAHPPYESLDSELGWELSRLIIRTGPCYEFSDGAGHRSLYSVAHHSVLVLASSGQS